jgi:hypothetical protein
LASSAGAAKLGGEMVQGKKQLPTKQHPKTGRLVVRQQRRARMAAVRDVCRHVRPEHPTSVRQAEFNEHRGAAGHPKLPQAHKICEQQGGVSWRRLLEIAFHERANRGRLLSTAFGQGRRNITLAQCVAAVQAVARKLGVPTLTRARYERERTKMLKGDQQAYLHGGAGEKLLPDLESIEHVLRREYGTGADEDEASRQDWWNQLLVAAELEPNPKQEQRAAMSVDEAVAGFAEELGVLPTGPKKLRAWANRAHNLPLKACDGKQITAAGRRLNERRKAAGLQRLPLAPRGFDVLQKASAAERLSPKQLDQPRLMRGLVRVIDLLDAGEHLSQRSIKRVARAHRATDDVPSWSAVKGLADRTGTTTESLMREAEQLHAANMNAADVPG